MNSFPLHLQKKSLLSLFSSFLDTFLLFLLSLIKRFIHNSLTNEVKEFGRKILKNDFRMYFTNGQFRSQT